MPGQPGPKHHGHFAGRCRARLQVGQRRMHGLIHILFNLRIVKIGQTKTATATGRAHFTAALLLGNHRHTQAHQRAHIGRQRAIGARHQHHVVFAGQTRHDLRHARVFGTGQLLHLFQQLDFGGAVQLAIGSSAVVQGARAMLFF